MKFSLIVATLGRSAELCQLFDSLVAQTHQNFEVIVVDQNDDDRARQIIARFDERLNFTYLTSQKGLSRARNVGMACLTGEVVGFPDDDCTYPSTLLENVSKQLSTDRKLAGVTGRSVDHKSRSSQGRWSAKPLMINRFNVWICATSYTIFVRASIVKYVGKFDETLGVGSGTKWGAGEEVNFLLHGLRIGTVRYDPNLCVQHPEPVKEFNERALRRTRLYNRGYGRVLSLHRFPLYFVAYNLARPALGSVLSLLKRNFPQARYYKTACQARLLGWLDKDL